jgi:predicted SnoaL-like aldol condensation-catalyzing enzyme
MNAKDIAVAFLTLAASGRVDEAYDLYVGESFRHHNPFFAGSAQSLKEGMRDNALKNPNKVFELQRAIEEGAFVAVHSRIQMPPGGASIAVVHIFHIEAGKILELWDVGQPVPESSVNEHGMF